MKDAFKVDENGLTEDGYHVLSPASKDAMFVSNMISLAVMSVIYIIAAIALRNMFPEYLIPGFILMSAVYLIRSFYLAVDPLIYYARYRYRITDDEVDVRRGVLTIERKMVPVERIHQVKITKGPVYRMFGLAEVTITTAGGALSLEYLEEDIAEGIAEKLNSYIVRILKGREDGNDG